MSRWRQRHSHVSTCDKTERKNGAKICRFWHFQLNCMLIACGFLASRLLFLSDIQPETNTFAHSHTEFSMFIFRFCFIFYFRLCGDNFFCMFHNSQLRPWRALVLFSSLFVHSQLTANQFCCFAISRSFSKNVWTKESWANASERKETKTRATQKNFSAVELHISRKRFNCNCETCTNKTENEKKWNWKKRGKKKHTKEFSF